MVYINIHVCLISVCVCACVCVCVCVHVCGLHESVTRDMVLFSYLQPVQVQDLWCVAAKDMLLEFIAKMQLPNK